MRWLSVWCIHSGDSGGASKPFSVKGCKTPPLGESLRVKGGTLHPLSRDQLPLAKGNQHCIGLGEGVWLQLCKSSSPGSRDTQILVQVLFVYSVWVGHWAKHLAGALGNGSRWDWQACPSELGRSGNATARVQTRGQGSPPQALGLMVKAGQSAMLTAGTAGLGGTQVTNWTVNILRWLWFIVQIRSVEKILGDWTKRQAALADKWTDHFVLRNNL